MSSPSARRQASCSLYISTSRPPPPSVSGGTSSSSTPCPAVRICPETGHTVGSLSIAHAANVKAGICSLCHCDPTTTNTHGKGTHKSPLLVYGGSSKEDMYAMLLQGGGNHGSSSSSGSHIKWKCRLPEFMEAGLSSSLRYVAGGGASGRAYLWSVLDTGVGTTQAADSSSGTGTAPSGGGGGAPLLKVWQAHYRPVTCVQFTTCGNFIATGGADGVVNVYSLVQLLSSTPSSSRRLGGAGNDDDASNVPTVATWSEHHLKVTSLRMMPSHRMVSSSLDQRIVLMETFSGVTLARILLPSAIHSLTSDLYAHRLYAGAHDGAIYTIDMDAYATASTAESATVLSSTSRHPNHQHQNPTHSSKPSLSGTQLGETILGTGPTQTMSALRGHDATVTCLALLPHNNNHDQNHSENDQDDFLLVSGDAKGVVRVWNLQGRVCTRVLQPWALSTAASSQEGSYKSAKSSKEVNSTPTVLPSPCSSILVVPATQSLDLGCDKTASQEEEEDAAASVGKDAAVMESTRSNHSKKGRRRRRGGFGGSGGGGAYRDASMDVPTIDLIQPLKRFPSLLDENSREYKWVTVLATPPWSFEREGHGNGGAGAAGTLSKKRRLMEGLSYSMSAATKDGNASSKATDEKDKNQESNPKPDAEKQQHEQEKSKEENKKLLENENKAEKELVKLRQELKEARSTIERWQTVNHKLAKKLKKAGVKL